jgi:hypothetical protein
MFSQPPEDRNTIEIWHPAFGNETGFCEGYELAECIGTGSFVAHGPMERFVLGLYWRNANITPTVRSR